MNKIWILGILNNVVKTQGELWLRSLDDQMNLHISSMGTHHPIRALESELDDFSDPPWFK